MSIRICWSLRDIQIERRGTRKDRKFTVINNGVRSSSPTNFFSEAKNSAFKILKNK